MPPKTTVWDAEPHTLAKHAILKAYLERWFPILASRRSRLIYYDGFAGPGRYSCGEEGSPLIALNVAHQHKARLDADLVFAFVEEKQDRAASLRTEVSTLRLPTNFKTIVINEQFEDALGKLLDDFDRRHGELAPIFAFVDPFGITGLPFTLLRRVLQRPSCEVFVTFMTAFVRRFVTELPAQVDELIGIDDASEQIASAENRVVRARELYSASLGSCARFVRFFEMRDNRNLPVYDLFFASNNAQGHYKMKEAMWTVDDAGEYRFSDGVDPNQATLFAASHELPLAADLAQEFRGREVLSEVVLEHVRNRTPYLEKHGRGALKLLEQGEAKDHGISVREKKANGKKRRKNSFPVGTYIRFQDR